MSAYDLPFTLTVDGEDKEINCDFRSIIDIYAALNDPELSKQEKLHVFLYNFYVDDYRTFVDLETALKQAKWFMDWGKNYEHQDAPVKLMDWEQDYNMIISAVDKNIKTVESVLELPFMHWWTFLSKLAERGECQLTTVLMIREKMAKGKPLEKFEKEILRENQDIIILKSKADTDFEKELWGE